MQLLHDAIQIIGIGRYIEEDLTSVITKTIYIRLVIDTQQTANKRWLNNDCYLNHNQHSLSTATQ